MDKRQHGERVATKQKRLIQQALRRAGCSPEVFARREDVTVGFYSARQVRRWAQGAAMPEYVAERLRAYVNGNGVGE